MKPAIEIKQLGKKYRISSNESYLALRDVISNTIKHPFKKNHSVKEDFWALKDIDLTIEKGERIGVIGRNGAGKSTLLKILSRVTWPTTGEAIIRGRLASLLEVGTGFHPELTGHENIFLNGSILGLKKAEIARQFDAIVDFSGVEKFLDTPLKYYSSGMQLRLAFAVAAHLEPEILVIDEVLAVGDLEFQKKCIGKMDEVSKQYGRTILFVSHQLDSVIKLCNKGIWLENGLIKETGPISYVTQQYIEVAKKSEESNEYTRPGNSDNHYFVSIKLLTSQINVGESLGIRINFNDKYKNLRLVININVLDEGGQLISHIINDDDGFSTESTKDTIRVNLEEINLVPGKYYLSFWAGYDMHHTIDWIEKVLAFEINELNTLTQRNSSFPLNSKIIIRSKWQAE